MPSPGTHDDAPVWGNDDDDAAAEVPDEDPPTATTADADVDDDSATAAAAPDGGEGEDDRESADTEGDNALAVDAAHEADATTVEAGGTTTAEPDAGPDAEALAEPDAATLEAATLEAGTASAEPRSKGPRHARTRRPRRRWPYVVGALVVAVGAAAAVQLERPIPRATPILLEGPTHTVSGSAPVVAWPTTGQAAFAVPALGLLQASATETPVPIASLTKIMTAYLVLHAYPLAAGAQGPTVTLTPADQAEAEADEAAGNAALPVKAGEQLTERQLLDGMLVPSADNFADVLGTWVAGSTSAFVAQMNATAGALGLRDTHYADTSGLDPGSASTAADQLRLAAVTLRDPAFAAVVDQPSVTLPIAGAVANTVRSIGVDGVVGVKSGFTDAAQGCLVLATYRTVGGHRVLVLAAVTGQRGPDPHAAADASARAVLDSARVALVAVPVAHPGVPVAVVRAPWSASVPLVVPAGTPTLVAWPGDEVRVRARSTGRPASTANGYTPTELVAADGDEHVVVRLAPQGTLPGPSVLWRLFHG